MLKIVEWLRVRTQRFENKSRYKKYMKAIKSSREAATNMTFSLDDARNLIDNSPNNNGL